MKITMPILCLVLGLSAVVQASDSDSLQGLSDADWRSIQGQMIHRGKTGDVTPSILKAPASDPNDLFSWSMDISGDTLVISSVLDDSAAIGVNGDELDNSVEDSGAVYVFVRRQGEWQKEAYLKASNPDEEDWFGEVVAIDGDTLAVSAILEDSGATGRDGDQSDNSIMNAGAVYVFVREDGQWTQEAYLKSSNPTLFPNGFGNNQFGTALDLSGDILVVGSPNKEGFTEDPHLGTGIFTGSAYVFERTGGVWEETAYLKAEYPRQFDDFGYSVAVSGETIVVGVPFEDGEGTGVDAPRENLPPLLSVDESDSGAAFVFEKTNGLWERTTYLKASNAGDKDNFGNAVDIFGDTIVVGAPAEDGDSANSGAAYIFVRSGDSWMQEAYLKGSDPQVEDRFGIYVRAHQDIVWVGAPFKDSPTESPAIADAGAGYLFSRVGGAWQETAFFQPRTLSENDHFGFRAALSGTDLIIGALLDDSSPESVSMGQPDDAIMDSGAAYSYVLKEGVAMQSGHSALWYNPDQSGHGLSIYALENDAIVAVWYVYDNEGRPLWLIGTGSHDGEKASLDVQVAFGGFFPPEFDATDVVLSDWGQFEIAFSDCNEATFRWMPVDGSEYAGGEMAIEKLTQTLGADCATTKRTDISVEPAGASGSDVFGAAQSALWYNPDQPGHGYSVYMLDDAQVVAVWYVFDDMGNPLWLIGTGSHNGESAVLTVNSAEGGLFPPMFSSDGVTLTEWGTMELRFLDCDSGVFSWAPNTTTGFEPGEVSAIRLTTSLGLGCGDGE